MLVLTVEVISVVDGTMVVVSTSVVGFSVDENAVEVGENGAEDDGREVELVVESGGDGVSLKGRVVVEAMTEGVGRVVELPTDSLT
jgi:hypothetical protein